FTVTLHTSHPTTPTRHLPPCRSGLRHPKFPVPTHLITGYDLTQLNDTPGRVVEVLPNTPAAAAGLQKGDVLKSVDGVQITAPDQLQKIENGAPNAAIVIGGVHAGGQPFRVIVTPRCDEKT